MDTRACEQLAEWVRGLLDQARGYSLTPVDRADIEGPEESVFCSRYEREPGDDDAIVEFYILVGIHPGFDVPISIVARRLWRRSERKLHKVGWVRRWEMEEYVCLSTTHQMPVNWTVRRVGDEVFMELAAQPELHQLLTWEPLRITALRAPHITLEIGGNPG